MPVAACRQKQNGGHDAAGRHLHRNHHHGEFGKRVRASGLGCRGEWRQAAPPVGGRPVTSTASFHSYHPATTAFFPCPRAARGWTAKQVSMADEQLKPNGQSRPSNVKHHTSPSLMMNSHFAGVGDNADKQSYEHGIQVIDEDKMFKYVVSLDPRCLGAPSMLMSTRHAAEICRRTSVLRKSSPLASTTTSFPSLARNPRASLRSSTTSSAPNLASCRSRSVAKPQRESG